MTTEELTKEELTPEELAAYEQEQAEARSRCLQLVQMADVTDMCRLRDVLECLCWDGTCDAVSPMRAAFMQGVIFAAVRVRNASDLRTLHTFTTAFCEGR